MRVHVDDTRSQHEAGGVDRLPRALRHIADFGDTPAADRDIGAHERIAHAVRHHRASDYQIMHSLIPYFPR